MKKNKLVVVLFLLCGCGIKTSREEFIIIPLDSNIDIKTVRIDNSHKKEFNEKYCLNRDKHTEFLKNTNSNREDVIKDIIWHYNITNGTNYDAIVDGSSWIEYLNIASRGLEEMCYCVKGSLVEIKK